ncbi:Zinc finger and BTB domain-containing protein 49 [Chionoecetes opilio]|uniref:Zinc finger and BTB domain-containing protein 49 n=1 Tax=Chionoecetes opilio TaxID=41210 RepID=A0A8J4Y298_CHIOP|nr:Zinc finger and BTB domain-containing protein 49 [Chionoecetes opilio]
MKCKVGEAAGGVGRSRPGFVSGAGPVSRLHKEDVSLNTRSNKGDKSEGNILRRSSRRATIERRVWAAPKKMARGPPFPSIKERPMQSKSSRRDRERRLQNTVPSKAISKNKASPDTKRGLVMTEETGNARRKIKKKEGMENVGDEEEEEVVDEVDDVSESATEVVESVESVSDVEDDTGVDGSTDVEDRTNVEEEEPSEHCIDSESSDSDDSGNVDSAADVMRTGLPLLAEAVVSLKNIPSRTLHSDPRVLEETLDTGEICLTKAVIEEIIPDYENESSCVSSIVECEVNARNTQNTGEVLRNVEEDLGHTYSKREQNCDVIRDGTMTEANSPVKEYPNSPISIDSEEAELESEESTALEIEIETGESVGRNNLSPHSEGEGEGDEGSREGDQDATDSCEAQLDTRLESESGEVNRDESEVESDEESMGSLKEDEDDKDNTRNSIADLKTTGQEESESSMTPDCATQKSDSMIEHTDSESSKAEVTETEVVEEEEDHVSLSVALAQLLDSGCDEAEGTETLTIHSACPGVKQEERKEVMALEVNQTGMVAEKTENELDDDDDEDEEEGELVIKEEEDEGGDEASNSESDEEDDRRKQVKDERKDSLQDSVSMVGSTRIPEPSKDTKCDSEADQQAASPTPAKLKKQIPPLIKICSRPPAIKTPLKCPECPMQFCTVRSLLWHFGTHGARSRENCLPPILLQDLIVPWDKPSVSLFISQATEGEKNTERVIASTEMSLAMSSSSDTALKVDTSAGQQDMIVATQIIRAEDGTGTNGDVILKVPIPRLKPKSQGLSSFKKDKFVNILPKVMSGDGQTSVKVRASGSPTPQVTIQAYNKSTEAVTIKPQKSVSKITIRADTSSQKLHVKPMPPASPHSAVQIKPLITSSQSAVQIQPLLSSSQSALQIQPLVTSSQSALQIQSLVSGTASAGQPMASTTSKSSSGTSHIALIPVDNLTAVGQNFPSRSKTVPPPIRMMAPSPLPVNTASSSMDGILEKDGMIMINSNLALRIVSSLPTSLDSCSTTSSTTIRPLTTHLTTNNNLTILPQIDCSKFSNYKKETMKNPDILTIVPQMDVSKKVSLLKNAPTFPSTQVSTPKGSAASQVVKLYLLHPKDTKGERDGDSTAQLGIPTEAIIGMNGMEVSMPFSNGRESAAASENGDSREHGTDEDDYLDDSDDDEDGMVIDDQRDGDEDVMDPLTMCAVTMEDENLDASNSSSQAEHLTTDSPASSEDKVTIRKIVGKPKGKNNQDVDMMKYEARKYVCCYCNRRFGWSTDLKRHVILHTGEKPFQCKICPTAFTRKFLLQNHMKRMHPDKCKMSDLWP